MGGRVGWWAGGGPAWRRWRGRSGLLKVCWVRSRGKARDGRAFLLFLRLRTPWAVACLHNVGQTRGYTCGENTSAPPRFGGRGKWPGVGAHFSE